MSESAPTTRKLGPWIDAFLDNTSGLPSPALFRKWGAITALSGALQRRCWTHVPAIGPAYANLFTVLVAPPAVGKSKTIEEIHHLWGATGLFSVAPTTVTKQGLFDCLHEAMQVHTANGAVAHSILVAASELGNLIREHDTDFLNQLNELYDCPQLFSERTRGGGSKRIDCPHIAILGGTQPKFLHQILPERAYGMGFTSRLIFVYAEERPKVSLFTAPERDMAQRKLLARDLEVIGHLKGAFQWEALAAALAEEWIDRGCEPAPTHPNLIHYIGRRPINLIKLAMVFSVSESSDLIVRESHVETAISTLVEVEQWMPEVFKDAGGDSDRAVIDQAFDWAFNRYQRTKKPIMENLLINFLSAKVHSYKISSIIEVMVQSHLLKDVSADKLGAYPGKVRMFVPVTKVERDDMM